MREIALEGYDMTREDYIKIKKKGFQFTIARQGLGKKSKQIERSKKNFDVLELSGLVKKKVDDIALVKVHLQKIAEYFGRWLAEGKPSGGPEQYMNRDEKKDILRGVTKDFVSLSEEDIEKAVS